MSKEAAGSGHKGAFVTVAFLLVYTSLTHIDWQLKLNQKLKLKSESEKVKVKTKSTMPFCFFTQV